MSPSASPPLPAAGSARATAPVAGRRRTHLRRSTRGWSRAIIWSLIGLTGFGAAYSAVAPIDSSISAEGRLRPAGGSLEVSAPFSATIRRVLVRDGQRVRTHQVLVELDSEEAARQRSELEALRRLWWTEANRAALQIGLPAVPPSDRVQKLALANQRRDLLLQRRAAEQRRQRSLAVLRQQQSDLTSLRQRLAINRGIRSRLDSLVGQGAISRLELDRQQERQVELEGQRRRTEQQLEAARRELSEGEALLQQVSSGNLRQLHAQYDEARRQWLETGARLEQLRGRLRLGRVLAPADGRVFDLQARAGELAGTRPLLRIVPEAALEAELAISNRDIGLIRPGMPVEVRVSSFPFSDYGSLKGTLLRVGADAEPREPGRSEAMYAAIVRIERSRLERRGRSFPLRSGMAVTGLVQLGTRPLLSLLNDRLGAYRDALRTIR